MSPIHKYLFPAIATCLIACLQAALFGYALGSDPPAFPRVTCRVVSGEAKALSQNQTTSVQVQDFVKLLATARSRKYFCVEQMEPIYEVEVSLDRPAPEGFIATLSFRGEAKLGSDYFVEGAQVLDSSKNSPNQYVLLPIPQGQKRARFILRITNDYQAEGSEEDRFENLSFAVNTSHTSSQYSYEFEERLFVILDDDRWEWENIQMTPPGKTNFELRPQSTKPGNGDHKFVCSEEIIAIHDSTNSQAAISLGVKQTAQDFIYHNNLIGVGSWEGRDSTSSEAQITLRFSQLSGVFLIAPPPATNIRPRSASRVAILENKKTESDLTRWKDCACDPVQSRCRIPRIQRR